MPLRIDHKRHQIEGWLSREGELHRIFGHRPADFREFLGEAYKVVRQEVGSDFMVNAWSPLWTSILSLEAITAQVDALEAEGWTVLPFRPVKFAFAPGIKRFGPAQQAPTEGPAPQAADDRKTA